MVAAEAGAKTEGWNWADLLRALRPSRQRAAGAGGSPGR
jgi:hypothetical protein